MSSMQRERERDGMGREREPGRLGISSNTNITIYWQEIGGAIGVV